MGKRKKSEDVIVPNYNGLLEEVRLLSDLQPGGAFLEDKTQMSPTTREGGGKSKSPHKSEHESGTPGAKSKEEEEEPVIEDNPVKTAIEIEKSYHCCEKKHSEDLRQSEPTSDEMTKNKKEGKKSFRAKILHTASRRSGVLQVDDVTIRGERHFLKKIERHKHRRLERYCICPVTKWLLFKERMSQVGSVLLRTGRCCRIVCCPPLCYLMPQIALWPPPNEYFFYVDNVPPRERKEIEGQAEAIEIAERKKKIPKILRANKKAFQLKEALRIGHRHPCADDIEDVEAFIVRTRRNNYVACVRIPVSGIPRYSILYSHPNASDLSDHLVGVPNLIDMARFHKCDVYSYDYCGYGISSGYASESNMKADIRAVYDNLLNERGIPPDQIVLIGYSIGCFASVDLACSITRPPAGLILQSPPASVLRVLLWERACFKKPFERQSCCADRFCTYDKIAGVRVPILVIHGEDDRTVPLVHGKAVCQKAVNRAAPLWLRASHDNVENCRETWLRIRKFIKYELKYGIPSHGNQEAQ
ncbi:hypothetical protein V3C99_009986 [Haemonchus contortus]|uniref:Peptidase_S9 domain-containing protein n=1 Tax=Haemonchus contortus TaxID=6289 RepID=A0A7I4YHK2_HAECO